MVKHFNIIMAGVISGIVALFTSILGVSGTVIGSVLSSFLYQLISSYYEEKSQDIDFLQRDTKGNNQRNNQIDNSYKVKNKSVSVDSNKIHRIVFIFPVFVILLIECLFCLTSTHYGFLQVFNLLEHLTDQNLFRVMGIGLMILSIYPFIKPKVVKKSNGVYLLIIGFLLLIRGLVDDISILNKVYELILYKFDLMFAIFVIIVLLIVIIRVLKDVFTDSNKNSINEMGSHARKVNTNFNDYGDANYGNYNNYESYNNKNFNNRNDFYHNTNNQNMDYSPNESIPIYEEDYIYVNDPNNPNRTIKKRILKKVNEGYRNNPNQRNFKRR